MKSMLLLLLTIAMHQLSAQCVFVSIKGPKCAGDSSISATFSRNPYQIEWIHNNVVIQQSKVVLNPTGSSFVSGNVAGKPKIAGTHGIAIDNNGNLYVSDTINNRIVAYNKNTPDGVVVAGGNGNGNLPSQLNKPSGLFIDDLGNLFVTDQYNNRVLRFAPGSTNGFLVAGGNGKGAAANQLSDPRDVYVDAQGFIYIADAGNHRIQKWAQGGVTGITVAGGLGAGADSLRLNSPQGVAVDKNYNIYVADSANHRIQKFAPNQLVGKTIMGQLGKGIGVENLFQPVDIIVDAVGDIYVLEAGNNRVQQLSIRDASVKTIIGNAGKLNYPTGIAFDISGNLYVLDQQNARVQQYAVDTLDATFKPLQGGIYTVRASSFSGCVQQSNLININQTKAINISGNTALCVGETTEIKLTGSKNYNWVPNKWVSKINDSLFLVKPDSSISYKISVTSDSGCFSNRILTVNVGLKSIPIITPSVCLSPDASKITTTIVGQRAASLNFYRSPDIITGSLFPTWNKVGSVLAGANGIGVEPNQFGLPTSAFVDQQGNVYVADAINHRIQFWKQGDTFGRTVAGGKGQGFAMNQLNYPTSLFVDAGGNMYIVDQNNHRIQYFAKGDSVGITVAGGYGMGNGKYQLNLPASVFVDQFGSIYVADAGNHRIQKWSNSGNEVTTVAGNGLPGNDNIRLNNPQAVYIDQRNNLFVADAENHRILMYDQTKATRLIVAGNNGAGILMNQLNFPTGIFVDGNSNIYITDRGNNRIQRWRFLDSVGVTVAGSINGISGFTLEQLQLPNSVGFDYLGNMIVADTRNIRILKYNISASIDSVYQTKIPGTYTAKATSFSGCVSNSGNAFVVVAPQLKIKTDSSTICEGTQTRLVVTGANNYKWSPNPLLNSFNGDTVIVRPLTTTKYTVSASSVSGCSATAEVLLTVHKKPIVEIISPTCVSTEPMKLSTSPKVRNALWTLNNNNLLFKKAGFNSIGETVIGKLISADTAQFGQPNYVYVDHNGHLYISDRKNNRIQKWLPGAKVGITVAGGNGAGSKLNQLNNPQSFFVTPDGLIYIADSDNDRIVLWKQGDTTGKVVAGGNGRGDKANQLSFPAGIFVDPFASLYIADANNARIQVWDKGSLSGKTVAGGNFPGAGANQLSYPVSVFVDQKENIYIADAQNDRIQRWKLGESSGSTIAGGNGKGNNSNQLVNPTSVFLDINNQLIITESGVFNRVKSWEIGVDTGSVIAGSVIKGTSANLLDAPVNAVVDLNGNLYVSDLNNFRIQRFTLADSTFSFNPTIKGVYSAQVNIFSGCYAKSDNFILDTGFIPLKPSGVDVQYCFNETPKPLVATGDRLRWYTVANGGVGAVTPPLPSTAYIGNTTYWVSSLNPSFGCESIRQKITVTIRPLPVARLSIMGNKNIMPGDTTIIKSFADSNRTKNKFIWYRNGSILPSIPDTVNRLFVFYSTIGKYHMVVTDSNRCAASSDTIEIKAALAAEQEMYLFPNPVQHSTKIVFRPLPHDKTFIKVISNGGLVIMNKQINTSNIIGNMVYDLELIQLPKGVYAIEIVTGSGRMIAHKQFIKL